MFAGKKSAQIREILINESAWEEMTCLFAPSLNLNFPGYLKMEYGSTKMEERLSRSPGGKLALWAFYTWCGYFVWAMARYIWVMSRIPDAPVSGFESDLGSTAGKWLGALVGFLFMALVGALLGSIAWYTRPRPARSRRYE